MNFAIAASARAFSVGKVRPWGRGAIWPGRLLAAVSGVAVAAFCYFVFDRGLSVPWPQAVLGDLLPMLRDMTGLL